MPDNGCRVSVHLLTHTLPAEDTATPSPGSESMRKEMEDLSWVLACCSARPLVSRRTQARKVSGSLPCLFPWVWFPSPMECLAHKSSLSRQILPFMLTQHPAYLLHFPESWSRVARQGKWTRIEVVHGAARLWKPHASFFSGFLLLANCRTFSPDEEALRWQNSHLVGVWQAEFPTHQH